MDKFKIVLLIFSYIFSLGAVFAHEPQEDTARDYLYSEAYFDYLIEMANEEHIAQQEQVQEEIKLEEEINKENEDEVTIFEFDDVISGEFEPFKLRIEQNSDVGVYGETFVKPETKIFIPTGDKLGFTYSATQFINKNYTDGRRMTSGIEYTPFKKLSFASGIETNYRDVDHNPLSRKVYFTPTLKLNDYFSISFLNKVNVLTHTSDHDIGLYVSPFKNKALDFKVFTGISNERNGTHSQSASFYTNFYFF
ncbi:MAG: hypothetical protein IJW73_07465 [Candidatus Gastranaerophilales bacterium]|nr:hypothetical protein [Candidatus Gastranaerophilales bacterium]